MNNVPTLRFKEFSDEWESKKLGELLEFKNGINASKEKYGYGRKFINVLDILNNDYITYENIIGEVDVDDLTFNNYAVGYGDVVFQRSSETREDVGAANVYLDKDRKATFGGFIIRGKKIGDYEPIFMNNLLKSSLARKEITTKSGGSTRYNVGQDILSEIRLPFPSLEEQEKIASFFSLIDKKIELQTEKVEELKNYKKGIMQKIFSQELRFKDENGNDYPEWYMVHISSILSIPEKIKEENVEKEKLLTVKLHRQGVCKNNNTDTLEIGATVYYIRKSGQLIYGKQNLFNGAIDIIPDYLDGYLSSGDVPALDIDVEKVIPQFILYLMGRTSFYKPLEALASGTGSKRIHEDTLLNIKISIPSILEQAKIVKVLGTLDFKIEKEQDKLDALNNLKKGLLQQMFV